MKRRRSTPRARASGWIPACCLLLLLLTGGCGDGSAGVGIRGRVKSSGSTTLLPIAQEAASEFTDANPSARVDVQGGGSSVGITQLGDGVVDVANSSRELTADELEAGLYDNKVAFDLISLVVNPRMPVDDLTAAQVRAVFTGEVTNWKALGGPDKEIVVVVRDQASGTREMFDQKALGWTPEDPVDSVASAIESSSNGVVREIIASTSNAIGYISFGYITRSLKAVSFDGVEPTVENASSLKYPLARYLHMFTSGKPQGAVKGYIDFVLSDGFQEEVVSKEYISIKAVRR